MGLLRGLGFALACSAVIGVGSTQAIKQGGGVRGNGLNSPPPSSGTWVRTTNHTSVALGVPLLLTDGTVIVQEPEGARWFKLTPDASGSYVNGTWSQIASLPSGYAPLYYASAVLADGRVVVIGGEYNVSGGGTWTKKGAIYNPATNTWANLNAPPGWDNVGDAQCTVLPDGRLLLAMPFDTRMAVLDPATLTWTAVNATGKTDRFDEEGWLLLADGSILTVDAINAPHCERLLPNMSAWIAAGSTPQSLTDPGSQEIGPMVLRPNGTVFAMGATGHNAVYTPGVNINDPGTWAAAPDFPVVGGQLDIADGPACLLPNGNVICYASPGIFNTPSTFFEFDGTTLTQVANVPQSPSNPSFVGNMLMLPTGQVLFTDFSTDCEIYTPAGGTVSDAWRPTVTNAPVSANPGQTFTLQGTQLNGLSQCTAYGDDSTNATNYPIVRITNNATGHVRYVKTHNHSTMAVATKTAIVSTVVDLPSNLELGASKLEVVANGIASAPWNITIVAAAVSGHVTLQSWGAAATNIPVTIEIRNAGTSTVVFTQSVNLDGGSNYQVTTGLANGTYDVYIKGSHWLRKKIANVGIAGGSAVGVDASLLNGDVNGDNAVNLTDYNLLKDTFGTTTNGPSDLNGDGTVTLADVNILKDNYGRNGD